MRDWLADHRHWLPYYKLHHTVLAKGKTVNGSLYTYKETEITERTIFWLIVIEKRTERQYI